MIDGENITAPIYGSNSNVSPNHFTDWTTSPDDLPCYSLYALYENQIYTDTIQYCMTGSGIAQIVNTDDRLVRLYPVPAGKDGKITVEINASAADLNSATIEICDVKGATVARHAAQGKQTEISVSGLPAGVYLLKVSSPVGLSHSLRFVVGR
jgi:hypothetical protein